MKTNLHYLFLLLALQAAVMARPVTAQTFTTLYNFTGGRDGAQPDSGFTLSGSTLFGTTEGGGTGYGTIFAINTNGTGFTNVYSFTGSNGKAAVGRPVLSGSTLYGTAVNGGLDNAGIIYAVTTNGTGFTNLYSFTGGGDGAYPYSTLILSGSTLYGTAAGGGINGNGTIFAINTNGTGFTNLYSFTGGSNGAAPNQQLILSGNTLYGTAYFGGNNNFGTIFAINTDGTGFTNHYSFTGGSNGFYPAAGLILSGSTLYGTAVNGGLDNAGIIYAIHTDGTGFTNLHSFAYISDGAYPNLQLILSGNTLYGGGQVEAAVGAMARYSPSTPMAPALPIFIVLRHSLFFLMKVEPTATELIRRD